MLLNDDITTIKGIGEKTAEGYRKLGISTVKDLIYYFPRDMMILSLLRMPLKVKE